MHELSIATAVIARATEAVEAAAGEGARPGAIRAVRVRIGELAGVVPEALDFAWGVAREGTACAAAELLVERVPARVRCDACAASFDLPSPPRFRCPRCGGPTPEVLAGRELEVASLELDDPAPAAAGTTAGGHHDATHS